MARLAGVSIPDKKRVDVSLTYIYGIGLALSKKVLALANINPARKVSDLQPSELNLLKEIIEKNYKIEGDLRREIIMNVKRLKDIASWRGTRHMRHLPVHGQQTKTNSRTVRGNTRKTVGSGRKPSASPT